MESLLPNPETFRYLTEADIAAAQARESWLHQAFANGRNGKQIPPSGPWLTLIFRSGRGFGKLLALDTPIPTPSGWTTMGEIKRGDSVFDESGRPCRVTLVSPVQFEPCYRVVFSDGTEIVAGASHQWVTWTHAERKAFLRSPYEDTRRFPDEWPAWRLRRWMRRWPGAGAPRIYPDSPGPRIRTTSEIAATLVYGKRGDTNHCIPQCGALVLPDADLPIPPYTLGAWLGDGSSADGSLYAHEDDMPFLRRQIEADGFQTFPRKDTQAFGTRGLQVLLRKHGLRRNKHVPAIYLRGSIAQRLALLRGLMDTDGGVDNANSCSFTNTNKALVDAVYELIVSLGMKATRDDRIPICQNGPGARAYRVTFSPTISVFTMPRKSAELRFDGAQALRRHHRMVVAVERTKDVALRCISVDGRHAMYLAGKAMIPTHNTRSEVEWLWNECWRIPGLIGHAVAPTISDMRGTLMEGPAGFRSCIPAPCLQGGSWESAYNKTDAIVQFSNGSRIRGFGATDGGSKLRGPQCHAAIADELREWDKPAGMLSEAFSNMEFGVRLPYPDGTPSRIVCGTTPKSIPYLKNLYRSPNVLVVTGSSYENMHNLSEAYRTRLFSKEGTQVGRVEIHAEDIDQNEDAIFKRNWFRLWPNGKPLPEFAFILISIDPAVSEHDYNAKKQTSDPSGLGIFGVFNTRQCFTEQELKKLNVKSKYAALLCDYWTERLGFPDLIERIRKEARKTWGKTPGRRADLVLIENEKTGISIRQTLMQYGVATWPFNPHGQSKTMRAHAASPMLLQGMLFVPESGQADRKGSFRNWAEPLVDQMCAFAGEGSTEHDESVDVICQAMLSLMERGMFHAEPQDRAYPDADEREEQERARAVRIAEQEKRGRYSPYGE